MPCLTPRVARPPRRQRGAAALVVTMVLFFAMLLIAAFANRGLVFEQRASANQYRATQAFEAAEAGLEWALAQLNNAQPLGADCRASADAAALPLRERLLRYNATAAVHSPLTWNNGGAAAPLQPACVRSDAGWQCSCPAAGHPNLAAPAAAAGAAQPAFTVQLSASGQPGVLRLSAVGCTSLAGACQPGAAGGAAPDATARVQVALALVPGLATLPTAPLTLKDGLAAGAVALGLHNPDAATGGVVLLAGGAADAPQARITTAPGASPVSALVQGDERLHARSADSLFASFFGIDKSTWRGQSAVRRIGCGGVDCGAALAAALASGHRLLWVDGDLSLAGPLTLGSPDRPVLIVASGAARLHGALALHGVVYAGALAWNDAPNGGFVRGALVSESGYGGDAAVDLFYDTAVLERLRGDSGSFTRVPGSWRDF